MKRSLFILLLSCINISAQESLFDFKADKRLFISFAFMNAAGNDAEWNKDGMHPVRVEVRKYLNEKLDSAFRSTIRNYVFSNHLEGWSNWASFGLMSDGTPEFNLSPDLKKGDFDSLEIKNFLGLQKYLKEFYYKSDIEELWKKYQPVLQAGNDQYIPYADKAMHDIISYCRIDSNYFNKKANKISYQKCPLMSFFTAQTLPVNGNIYLVIGPMQIPEQPSAGSFYHESLHHPIGEILKGHSQLVEKYSDINAIRKDDIGYHKWDEFVEDCLVRTISIRLEAKLYNSSDQELIKKINDEYKIGMILCPYFNEELEKYEKSDLPLDKYIPKLLSSLNMEREKKRMSELMINDK